MVEISEGCRVGWSIRTRQPGMPPGVSQADCDGTADELADASEAQLWGFCRAPQREAIARRFAEHHADDVRDALVDAQAAASLLRSTAVLAASPPPAQVLGARLWRLWLVHRDRALNELHRRGQLRGS